MASVKIFNVNYDVGGEISDKVPAPIYKTFVTNRGHIKQCGSRDINLVNTKESSFTSKFGIEFGVAVKIEAGIPSVAKHEVTISTKHSIEFTWGRTSSVQTREAVKANICVPPR